MFGPNRKITQNSFFKQTYDIIVKILKNEFEFDNILIDAFKITNEKFVMDYVNNLTYIYFIFFIFREI
jgi:hypothetical protein